MASISARSWAGVNATVRPMRLTRKFGCRAIRPGRRRLSVRSLIPSACATSARVCQVGLLI